MENPMTQEKSEPAPLDPAHIPNDSSDSSNDKYLHGLSLVFMTLSLMAGVFTLALDNCIIATAIPKLTSDFDSLGDVAWYGSVYLLAQMSFQPTFGKLYTFFNLKWVYLGALALFEAGSVICAAAPNSPSFIAGRAVAGLGAAGLFCGGLIIMTQIVEMRKRPLLLSIVTSMYGVASVVGPALGGVFTNSARLTWRFSLGGIVGLALCFYYPASFGDVPGKTQPLRKKLARLGFKSALILTATLVCLFLALQWGGAVHPWSDSRVWGCFLGFALLLILFGYIQHLQKDEALIPLRILSQRTVFLSCAFSCLLQGGLMSQSYNLPFYFQAVKGTNAQASGIDILPYGITNSVATVIAGSLMTLTGFYVPFMWLGSAISVTGSGLLYTLSASSPLGQWFGYQVLAGVGCGMSIQVPILAIQVVLSTVDIPLGTTLVILAQCFGGAIGLAIAQNVFQNSLFERLHEIQGIDVLSVVATGGVDLQDIVPAKLLDAVRDAFNGAVANAFLVAVGVGGGAFLVSLGVERRRIQTRTTVQGS
ncbi:major facilitator superfamily domain-containing protein [Ilyonectria robusta]|uniref:major facilitator superfamily domain-containing protein n=1 Tax=Ilyonectria robusta TaxID=1079257 RepID=UPI001E8E41A3|nr:major facilitator superfamily domain-containing protein [Ilyonectria robusta]KAH8666191.1 major facilitator superfamily domain-containing protein [Ilyonectria robusta]